HVFITEVQCRRRERSRFSTGQLPCTEGFDAGGNGRNLVEDAEAGFDDFIWCEPGVANRDSLKCVAIADEHAVGANEPIETRVQLIGAAAVVRIDQAKLRRVFALDRNDVAALEANQMLLETATFVEVHPLLERRDWRPTGVAQSGDQVSGGNKRITR